MAPCQGPLSLPSMRKVSHCISLAQEKIKIQKSIISIECTLLSHKFEKFEKFIINLKNHELNHHEVKDCLYV